MAKRKKRAPGEGHIRQRADKRWEWIYTVRLWNGRSVQKSLIKRKQADLMRERRRILAELEQTGYARTDLTVAEYLRPWLSDSVEGSVKDTTYDGYEHIVRVHLDPRVGHVKVRDLTPAHVIDLKTEYWTRATRPAPSATSYRPWTPPSSRPWSWA